jgi:hypothetical protein
MEATGYMQAGGGGMAVLAAIGRAVVHLPLGQRAAWPNGQPSSQNVLQRLFPQLCAPEMLCPRGGGGGDCSGVGRFPNF